MRGRSEHTIRFARTPEDAIFSTASEMDKARALAAQRDKTLKITKRKLLYEVEPDIVYIGSAYPNWKREEGSRYPPSDSRPMFYGYKRFPYKSVAVWHPYHLAASLNHEYLHQALSHIDEEEASRLLDRNRNVFGMPSGRQSMGLPEFELMRVEMARQKYNRVGR